MWDANFKNVSVGAYSKTLLKRHANSKNVWEHQYFTLLFSVLKFQFLRLSNWQKIEEGININDVNRLTKLRE